MIKVIEMGKVPDPEYTVKCIHCKCVFGYDVDDINPNAENSYVACPTCTRRVLTSWSSRATRLEE